MGTHVESISQEWKDWCKRRRCAKGKTVAQARDVKRSEIRVAKYVSHVPRKAAIVLYVPVP